MRIKDNYLLREIAGTFMVVPCGEALAEFNGMITLNETGAFLWNLLSGEQTTETLLAALLEAYDVEASVAEKDIHAFLNTMREGSLLIES